MTVNIEKQKALESLVRREVYYCVSELVSELASKEEYADDLIDVLYAQDSENEDEYREVFEHWIVSDWLADKLSERGEAIIKDFFGLTIWGRTTTGQAIFIDSVIEEIYDSLS